MDPHYNIPTILQLNQKHIQVTLAVTAIIFLLVQKQATFMNIQNIV